MPSLLTTVLIKALTMLLETLLAELLVLLVRRLFSSPARPAAALPNAA